MFKDNRADMGGIIWNDAGALDINEASFINNVANIILLELFGSILWHAVCNKNTALCKDSCITLKDSLKFTRTPPSQKWTPCNAIVQGLLQFL